MTNKEVMQMALDALEAPYPGIRTDFCDAMTYREKVKTAIEALRTALAQPEKEWVGVTIEEVDEWDFPHRPTVFEFVQFIESKLRERMPSSL